MFAAASMPLQPAVEATQNRGWGFCGVIDRALGHRWVEEAWAEAMIQVHRATGCGSREVRAFLDSRHGRYFGDAVSDRYLRGSNLQKAITEVVDEWMAMEVSKATRAKYGIPPGVPYLTAFVVTEAMFSGED